MIWSGDNGGSNSWLHSGEGFVQTNNLVGSWGGIGIHVDHDD